MNLWRFSLGCVLFCLCCLQDLCLAASVSGKKRNAGRSIWIEASRDHCPRIYCHPVPASCEIVEAIVFPFQGVWCESCPYCLDWPFDFAGAAAASAIHTRRRRSITHQKRSAGHHHSRRVNLITPRDLPAGECPMQTQCPPLPQTCHIERVSDIYWYGRKCWHCPVCYRAAGQP